MRRALVGATSFAVRAGLVALCLIATACGEAGEAPGGGPVSSTRYSGAWRLTDGRGPDGEVPVIKGYRITLDIGDRKAGGTAACNSYGGDLDINGDSFSLKGGLAMTEMACDPEAMDSEAAYMEALAAVDTIAREGGSLTLTGPDAELHFEGLSPPPIAQLTDTIWRLDSLIEGIGPEGTAVSAAPARLILMSDGKLSGSTGCREFDGEWQQRGDEILFTRLTTEGNCPPDLQDQDNYILGVLGDGFTAEIEGQSLTVFAKAELGLHYVAEPER
ncbi:MAG: META domain-containing protein [Actinomycetota bacterium]|nr:META domain-containing protein [Actinomycetota bacterium]